MFTVEHHRGRLVETRLYSLQTVGEVEHFERRFRDLFTTLGPRKVVVCGDYRGVRAFVPEVAERFCALLVGANPNVERSGILLTHSQATAALQIEHTIRDVGNPARRTFRTPSELEAWLAEVLAPDEKKRMQEFLRG